MVVVDPVICMTWIKHCWDNEYVVSAEEMILKLVSRQLVGVSLLILEADIRVPSESPDTCTGSGKG
jgi:hypothetical protein